MKLRPLVIDDKVIENIKAVVAHAEKNAFTMDDLLDMKNGQKAIAGNLEEYTVHINFGYKVVFSIEDQPSGMIRHLSASVNEHGKMPSVPSVEELIRLFGFQNKLHDCHLGLEEVAEGHYAINVLEKIN